MMTTDMWRDASRAARIAYRVERHPLLVLLGHSTLIAALWRLSDSERGVANPEVAAIDSIAPNMHQATLRRR